METVEKQYRCIGEQRRQHSRIEQAGELENEDDQNIWRTDGVAGDACNSTLRARVNMRREAQGQVSPFAYAASSSRLHTILLPLVGKKRDLTPLCYARA